MLFHPPTNLDTLWVIIYKNFGSNQPPFSLKEQLFPPWSGQFWQIKIENLVTNDLTYSSNTFLGLCYFDFCYREGISCCHIHYSWKKYFFLRFRSSYRKVFRSIFSWNKCKTSNKRCKSLLRRCWQRSPSLSATNWTSIKSWDSSCLCQFPYSLF